MTIPMCPCWTKEYSGMGCICWRQVRENSSLHPNIVSAMGTIQEYVEEHWNRRKKKCPHCGEKARMQ